MTVALSGKNMRLHPIDRNQDRAELEAYVEMAMKLDVRRYLEIGSRKGNSFYAVMANLRPGAFGMSIDLPETAETIASMGRTAKEIEEFGSNVTMLFTSSRNYWAQVAAAAAGPFDLVFIDGDHRYEGVMADWKVYASLAPVVALHDVTAPDDWLSDGHINGVGRFWREIEAVQKMQGAQTQVIATPGSKMGYGIVFRTDRK